MAVSAPPSHRPGQRRKPSLLQMANQGKGGKWKGVGAERPLEGQGGAVTERLETRGREAARYKGERAGQVLAVEAGPLLLGLCKR